MRKSPRTVQNATAKPDLTRGSINCPLPVPFTLGIEGLERFVRKEPLRRVHECVFGVLALESEPVDPRL